MSLLHVLLGTLIVGLCTYIVYSLYQRQNENRETYQDMTIPVEFVQEEHFVRTVMSAPYFDEMNEQDLDVRSSATREAYQQKYVQGREEFRKEEKEIIHMLLREVQDLLSPYIRFKNIPWKFAKLSRHLEQGFPHTLGDMIVLSDDFFDIPYARQKNILIHEKVHVYQRLNPETLPSLYEQWGFQRVSTVPQTLLEKRRNNPDLQGWYQFKNKIVTQLYEKDARMLSDSKPCMMDEHNSCTSPKTYMPSYIGQVEHPNEIMASMIPLIIQNQVGEDEWTSHLRTWMQRYFA